MGRGDLGVFPAMLGRHMALFMSVNMLTRFSCGVTSAGMRYGDAFLQLTSWFLSFPCFSLVLSHGELLFTPRDTKGKSDNAPTFMELVY